VGNETNGVRISQRVGKTRRFLLSRRPIVIGHGIFEKKNNAPLAIFMRTVQNEAVRRDILAVVFLGGVLMSQAEGSRLNIQASGRQLDGRPCRFPALDQDDRVRRVFGLPEGAPLPPVGDDALAVYHDYLTAQLSLPFEALYCQNDGEMRQLIHYIDIRGLIDPRQGRNRNLHGLFCMGHNHKDAVELPLAELGVLEDNPNCSLIDDYAYWFVNFH